MDILYRAMFSVVGVAIAAIVIHFVFHLIFHVSLHSRRVARIVGIFVASLGAFFFLTKYNELQEIPKEPESISMDQVAEGMAGTDHLWVAIHDGEWDCNNMAYDGTNTFAVLSGNDSTLIVVASFNTKLTCDELREMQPTGRLARFVNREFLYISNHIDFSRYTETTSFLILCIYCGRKNSQLGVVMGIFFMVGGLFYDKVSIIRQPPQTHTTTPLPPPKDSTN